MLCQWEGVLCAEGVALLVVGSRRDCTGHASFGNCCDCTGHASSGSYREYMRKPLFDLQEEVAMAALYSPREWVVTYRLFLVELWEGVSLIPL